MERLPPETQTLILSYLPQIFLIRYVRHVCKLWSELAYNALKNFEFSGEITENHFLSILPKLTSLERLWTFYPIRIQSSHIMFSLLSQHCWKSLTALSVASLSSFSIKSLIPLRNLRSLRLNSLIESDNLLVVLNLLTNVVSLDIRHSHCLRKREWECLGTATHLRELDLSGVRERFSNHMHYLTRCSDLTYLNIGFADTTTEEFEPITALRNLRTLGLRYVDKISIEALNYITGLNQLQSLDLSFCHQLNGNIAQYLKYLTNLKQLMLESVKLSEGDFVDVITTLRFLTTLELPDLTYSPHLLLLLTCMTSLHNLIIPRFDVQKPVETVNVVWPLSTLTSLSFGRLTPIPKSALESIENMTNLQSLELMECAYSDLKYLTKLRHLTSLTIHRIELVNGDMSQFLAFTSLQVLRMIETIGLTRDGIVTLTALSGLQNLYLGIPYKQRVADFSQLRTLFSPYALIHLPQR